MAVKINKISESNELKDNKDILFDVLERCGVTNVEVTFSGGGDDGQIDELTLFPERGSTPTSRQHIRNSIWNHKIEGVKVSDGVRWDEKTKTSTKTYKKSVTTQELVDYICYQVLEEHFGGWEDNEGGCGTFYFDVQKRNVDLDFNENFVETRNSRYRF